MPDGTIAGRRIAVVGLGYVGLPLAVAFGQHGAVVAFDVDDKRVETIRRGEDPTQTVSLEALARANVRYTTQPDALNDADFLIIAVPTPVDEAKRPDLTALVSASTTVGRYLKPNAIVVYESTVYPGATEEVCIPILERTSGLVAKREFAYGYSPERINPGDREHTLETVVKVVAGSDAATADTIARVYATVAKAGLHRASSVKAAEAAKVIENTQRDLNIALMNELALIFHRMGLNTREVLAAAGTKWNFARYFPGLVGGHCIGVDPYYLTYKAEQLGHHPDVILAGRRINDGMGRYVAQETVKALIRAGKNVKGAHVLVLGLTFKENVADLRNSRVVDLVDELAEFGVRCSIHDPMAPSHEVVEAFGQRPVREVTDAGEVDAVVLAVPHDAYRTITLATLRSWIRDTPVLIDVKEMFPPDDARVLGFVYWSL
jgi:UDP-N-acetyl-D-galactosamine dehydrogenase